MIRVANQKCIRTLSFRSMRASRARNLIAILAIALTTILFTSLFTIAMSINESVQQANFRQVGGYAHGVFKYVTAEQIEELKADPLIQSYGTRLFVGMPMDVPFQKTHVEVSYADANWAEYSYIDLQEGSLPKEETNEAATDIRVLSLLGVEPKLGARFSLTFDVDGTETTRDFTLCGWWENDDALEAGYVLIPESRAQDIFTELGTKGNDKITSFWSLDVMLPSAAHIEEDLLQILANHGYQNELATEENYIDIGINWGYTGAQLTDSLDASTAAAIIASLLLIMFTGYLIIYNVFQISVVGDIQFYGLLKTIGTTPRQIRKILRGQALVLSLCGIPLGLLLGWFVGTRLTPFILLQLDGVVMGVESMSPFIFILASLFSFVTVFLSCRRPGRIAGKVSPMEAVRYTQGNVKQKKKEKHGKGKVSLHAMALANLGRSKSKTVVTILSLSLAVVLLNMTVAFTNGFDMDKYLRDRVADFIVSNADYFQNSYRMEAFSEDAIQDIISQEGIEAGGRVYASRFECSINAFVPEDYLRSKYAAEIDQSNTDSWLSAMEGSDDGLYVDQAELYAMEEYALGKVTALEGNIDSLREAGSRNIAAVFMEDDYGNVEESSHWAKLGDAITLRYIESYEYYDPNTGKIYGFDELTESMGYAVRAKEYQDIEYTVTALVTIPKSLGARYYGTSCFIINDQTFIQDFGSDALLLYACDMTDEEATSRMETFLADYTGDRDSMLDYESKATYQEEFDGFRNMFLMLGGALSFIVGLVGVLNFFNTILTGILTRKREFAMLQSIGMTGKQLKIMLIWEGLYYVLGAIVFSLILYVVMGPLFSAVLESMFWFFTYHFSIRSILVLLPIFVVLGTVIPLVVYRSIARSTIVERLRAAE